MSTGHPEPQRFSLAVGISNSIDCPTGASDLARPGPLSLIDHEIAHEKTVIFVRHGMTTWNEQKKIQVSLLC